MPEKERLESKLEELKKDYSKTKYNKATNKYLGLLRAKIAKTKREIIEAGKRKKGSGFFVKKTGDATVALVGFPSAGKSTLINAISNADSKTAGYAFTTTEVIPGMLIHNYAHIQVFDLPGIIENASINAGGGRTIISAAKVCDLIVFVIESTNPEQLDKIMGEFRKLEIYVNKEKPDFEIHESEKPGLVIDINKSGLDERTVHEILSGLGIKNSIVRLRSKLSEDELISLVSGKSTYVRAIVALSKIDIDDNYRKTADSISRKYGIEVIPISVFENTNINELMDGIYNSLELITIYMKPRLESEKAEPMILRKGATVGDAANKMHTKIIDELKCAYVKGPSIRFGMQRVGIAHVLMGGDTVTLIKK